MNECDIITGLTYLGKNPSDIKRFGSAAPASVRRVLSIDREYGEVKYTTVSTPVGRAHTCGIKYFASWAVARYDVPPTVESGPPPIPVWEDTPKISFSAEGYRTTVSVSAPTNKLPPRVRWEDVCVGEVFTCDGNMWLACGFGEEGRDGILATRLLNFATMEILENFSQIDAMRLERVSVDITVLTV